MKLRFSNIFFLFLFVPMILSAANPSDLEKQIDNVRKEREILLEEQKRLQIELEAVNKEAQTLGGAVKSLDATRKKLASDINITQSKISSTNLTIKSLENTMNEKEQQIVIHRRAIADTLTRLSDYDSRPLLLNLLATTKLSDIWGDRNRLEDLNTRLEEEIKDLRETRKALNQEKAKKEKVKKNN